MKANHKINRPGRTVRSIGLAILTAVCMAGSCFATGGGFAESKLATGTLNLANDVSSWLCMLGPVVGGLYAVYYLIRRSMADETDGKMWTKRAWTAGIIGVGVLLVSGIIALLTGYYI